MDIELLRTNDAPPVERLVKALAQVPLSKRNKVEKVLYDTKCKKIVGELPGRQIKTMRELKERVRPALRDLRRLRRHLDQTGSVPTQLFNDQMRWLESVDKVPVRNRRKEEGRHAQLWLTKAREKLKLLGIKRILCEDLLLAAGLRKLRSDPTPDKPSIPA